MEDFWTRQSLETTGLEQGSIISIGGPSETTQADDPLGDEGAFPSTWQHLASGDASRD
jgi:hypothetical protein